MVLTTLQKTPDNTKEALKQIAQQNNIPLKDLFIFIRLCIVGTPQGPGIQELIALLGSQEVIRRIQTVE